MNFFRRLRQCLFPRALSPHSRSRRTNLPVRLCVTLYTSSTDAVKGRLSAFGHEPLRVPAYEDRALSGKRAPHRFECRGRWYHVTDTSAVWRDSRRLRADSPEHGRSYFAVVTADGHFFQLAFQRNPKKRENGSWTVYPKVTYLRTSRLTGAALSRR